MTFHEETIKELLTMYYEGILDDLNLLRFDNEKIVAKDEIIGQVIAINLKNIGINTKNSGWYSGKFEQYDYPQDNPKLKYYPRKGFFQKGYCEFLISYSPFFYESFDINFSIEDVNVHIGEPSNLFKLMFNHIIYDDHADGSWDMFQSISLNGIKDDEVEVLLEQALFYLAEKVPSDYNDYPEIYTFYGENGEDEHYIDENKQAEEYSIKKSQYSEVFSFYNEARRKHDPLSFYRVLEYFFIINRKAEFKEYIDNYHQNNNLDMFINDISKIYNSKEEDMLTYLLNTLDVKIIVQLASEKKLIEKSTNEELAKNLYKFRNSIVHSKKEAKNDFLLPGPLSISEKEKWLPIIEKLAKQCILHFCI